MSSNKKNKLVLDTKNVSQTRMEAVLEDINNIKDLANR
jgi:hypothetical protein